MAKLAIDRARIVFCKKKIGIFSFKIGRSGDFHYFIKNRKISRKIGRLGSSAHVNRDSDAAQAPICPLALKIDKQYIEVSTLLAMLSKP